jgi:hypothetical protein
VATDTSSSSSITEARSRGELFAEEERKLAAQIEAIRVQVEDERKAKEKADELSLRFEEVAAALRDLDIDSVWSAATESEKRVLVEELVDSVAVFPDHLEVELVGVDRLNVTLEEVGLVQSHAVDVGSPTPSSTDRSPSAGSERYQSDG